MFRRPALLLPLMILFVVGGPLSALPADPTNLVSTVISTMADNDLDCQKCSLTTGNTGDSQTLAVEMIGSGLDQLDAFCQQLAKGYQVSFLSFRAGPNTGQGDPERMKFAGTIRLEQGAAAFSLAEYLKPFDALPFLSFQTEPLDTPKLLGFTLETPREKSSFRIITPSIAACIDQLKADQQNGWHVLEASRGIIGGSSTISLEITRQTTPLTLAAARDLFTAEQGSSVRITAIALIEDVLKPSSRVSLECSIDDLPKALAHPLLSKRHLSRLAIRFRCDEPLQLSLQLEKFAVGQTPDPRILQSILQATWPDETGAEMQVVWELGALHVQIPVTGEEVAMTLHPVAQQLGLSFRGFDRKRQRGGDRLAAVFVTQGKAGSAQGSGTAESFDNALSFGKITYSSPTSSGNRYVVEFPWAQSDKLLQALSKLNQRRLVLLKIEPFTDEAGRCTMVLADGATGNNYREPALKLLRSFFPPKFSPTGTYVDGLDMNSAGEIYVCGETSRSSQIFTRIFPILKNIPGFSAPFFREGKYHDTANGRRMKFRVTVLYSSRP